MIVDNNCQNYLHHLTRLFAMTDVGEKGDKKEKVNSINCNTTTAGQQIFNKQLAARKSSFVCELPIEDCQLSIESSPSQLYCHQYRQARTNSSIETDNIDSNNKNNNKQQFTLASFASCHGQFMQIMNKQTRQNELSSIITKRQRYYLSSIMQEKSLFNLNHLGLSTLISLLITLSLVLTTVYAHQNNANNDSISSLLPSGNFIQIITLQNPLINLHNPL